ncbi:ATP-dependent DNA helicase RecG [Bacillus suaedaesalsae]|uniref:ATP-dependent DNA helicase RecG n=1 Tax=Bacillus suaedaesalsae TaxID=2810349 RepID=A0ABS2DJ54_9BACI|nr:ATP-dependent DNA helicase RecG [Bacillus suaedaesalsae]
MSNFLNESVINVKGIGPESQTALEIMGLFTVGDLLEHIPYRYEDYRLKDLEEVKHDERVTVQGVVHSAPVASYFGRKKSRITTRVLVDRYLLTAVFFNQPYVKSKLTLGSVVTLTGKWDKHRQTLTVSEMKLGDATRAEELKPLYHTKGEVTTKALQRYIQNAFKQYEHEIKENLPASLRDRYKLLPRMETLKRLHFPSNFDDVKQARRRMVYEEFLLFQLKMQALRKYERENSKGIAHTYKEEALDAFIQGLPFPLTNAQERVVKEITDDLRSPYRMNRLLQGDVGSGKTVVAAIALYAITLSGFQGALMVPTEILAEQHEEGLKSLLEPVGIKVALLTSSVKGKQRRLLLENLKEGKIDILIGTHALIQDEVDFKCLGLVITDEQHRFGVEQRRILREKGVAPDVLFMTATPIPRTLAITAFGEMDVSIIDELPAGRKKIETYWVKHNMIDRVIGFIEKELQKGRQAYVICPLIEESEKLDVQNAIDVHVMLSHTFAPNYRVGLMHGRLSSDEKEDVMKAFSANEHHILVSTTVVEVGVNVPNATIMVIYDAERFGLSQLHQLRGRVGRGAEQSYCILLADPKSEAGKERMTIMTETNDGFVLSEKDLELRGPGDFFGKKQSGLPEFKIADMVHDYRALEVARQDAVTLINSKTFWESDEYKCLRETVLQSGALAGEKLD